MCHGVTAAAAASGSVQCLEEDPEGQYDAYTGVGGKMSLAPPGGLEPPTFRLTAERANLLRHGGYDSAPC